MRTRFSDFDVGRWAFSVRRLLLQLGTGRWTLGVGRFP